jgi:predicted transcriptional regulator
MSDRQLVLETVQQMPESASLAEILDELALLATVKERLARAGDEQRCVSHEEVVKMLDRWVTR